MIQVTDLTMHYGPVVALDRVSFEVRKGEVVGLLGPNGAGKSTTMKILTTYLYPTAGKAVVAGCDVTQEPLKVRQVIGYLPEVLPLYMDMEVRSYLDFVGRARGLSGARLKHRMELVVETCGLKPMFRKIIRELSKGYRQRTALAQALIHDPEVVILDEPTSGLDPHQIIEIRNLIEELAKDKTVILSTHILQEVEATADRIVIINRGKIVGDGTIEQLRERAKESERYLFTVSGEQSDVQKYLSGISGVKKVQFIGSENGFVSFLVVSKLGMPIWRELNELAISQHWTIKELSEKPLTLEETFLTLTEKEKPELELSGKRRVAHA
ncbi:MAG TPA: ATP-binding cassette domain-containing protein [Candidatus Hydrogenedens sp.]|nr:ATP-binding cassette domain-containing protein [Candidatus Hydrogenedens sp.]HOL19215.1 ATP-binding cassette domain-containing protein [Candidatus Hydrogenedens sp.]HPP58430.1 ATP-binding cassette domain-containing protein [Candidatus Hydrogenedens sp.]